MVDPVSTLLLAVDREIALLPTARLTAPGPGVNLPQRLGEACGRAVPAGVAAFLARYDGGTLTREIRILPFEESLRLIKGPERAAELKGLWPILEREGRLFALDVEYPAPDGEWPVVELADRSVDRAGSTLLRYLHLLLGELTLPADMDPVARARELCRRDPTLAEHWVDLIDVLDRAGDAAAADEALFEGLRTANPLGPSLVMAVGLRAVDRGEMDVVKAAIHDALDLEPLTSRDDDARLDAAALAFVLGTRENDKEAAARAQELLGSAAPSTAAFWRFEAVRALVAERPARAELALSVVAALLPDDTDAAYLREHKEISPESREGLEAFIKGREALDAGEFEEASRLARVSVLRLPQLGFSHALLAEALSAQRERGAMDAARRAVDLNPSLVEAWRELGDGHLEMRQAVKAEEAYRQLCTRDPASALGLAKLAQALLEQGRTREALESIDKAADRGGDAFFVNAVRGDVLAEMNRHADAAEAYDRALVIEPEDHWALHQAALEHGRAGNEQRAMELFERAIDADQDGCHQTLVDFADLMRRMGRIGDAVRLYRRAVAAVPGDPEWRQFLREAERELQSAPN